MTAPDIVNGLFEVLGGLTTALNIRALMRDKEVKGVDWRLTFFYTAWGLWNLFYYPHLGQWASFAGGVVIVAGNAVWLALVIHYRRRAVPEWLKNDPAIVADAGAIVGAAYDHRADYEAGSLISPPFARAGGGWAFEGEYHTERFETYVEARDAAKRYDTACRERANYRG